MTALYVGATLIMMAQSTVETCHNRAALYDEGDWVILVLVVASAAASFVAIFAELPRRSPASANRWRSALSSRP